MTLEPSSIGNVRPIKIEEEMRSSYLDYAMSVIVARALPDIRDGLKPVQRRILHAMNEMGYTANARYRKCAGIVGEVLKNYHPHGDSPVYEALVRLAQPFSLRYPLVDGQGNFGSVDGDPPAAYRYTEARLTRIAGELLADIDKNTVDFFPNFDDEMTEPNPLPARFPNLLANGAAGIAVGMATNIPPHNLSELCDAIALLIDNPEATTEDLAAVVKGPDFPTGGVAFRYETVRIPGFDGQGPTTETRDAIRTAYADGKGRVVCRARSSIEETSKGRAYIVVHELPYQTNKAALVEKIADLVRSKRIEGIADLRDESDRHGMRIVIEIKREAQPGAVLNALYKHTAMQSTFAVNMLALVDGQPRTVSLKKILDSYINHRRDVIRRRSEFDLEKARDRAHILEGLLKAIDMLDQVIRTIRGADSAEDAKNKLMANPFDLTDRQAQAVLDMQLRRLARLERGKIQEEYKELLEQIAYLEDLLANPRKIDHLIREDAVDLKDKYGDERRTIILDQQPEEFSEEDLVAHQEVVVSISSRGYIKRVPLSTYRAQHRGGVGIIGARTKEDDDIRHLVVADTHDKLIFFTDRGRCFQVKTYEVDEGKREARGISVMQLLTMDQRERITAVVRVPPDLAEGSYMVMGTRLGEVKKTVMKAFANVRRDGIIAMDLEAKDEFVGAHICTDTDDVMMVTAKGQAIRFSVKSLRSASRTSGGVRGIRLRSGDQVVGMEVPVADHALLVVSALGQGKRTPTEEYPRHGRGGQGVITFRTHPKSGDLIAARMVDPEHELIFISEQGIIMRTPVRGVSLQGRPTQGVNLMNVSGSDRVAAVAVIDMNKDFSAIEVLPTGAEVVPTTAAQPRLVPEVDGNGSAPQAQAEDEGPEGDEEPEEESEDEVEGEPE
jgi:DNA gyrase subunit A